MSVEIAVDTQEARWDVVRHKVYSDETLSSEEKAAAYKQLLKQDLTLVERLLKVPSQHLTGVLRNELPRTHEGGPPAGEARGDAGDAIGTSRGARGRAPAGGCWTCRGNAKKGSPSKDSPPKGSPPRTMTEAKTVALTKQGFSIHDRFPNLSQAGPVAVECRLEPRVRDYLLRCMMRQAGGIIKGSVFSSEVAYVHVARPLVMTVIALLGPESDTRLLPDEEDRLVQDIAEDTEHGDCRLAYEQWIRAGSLNGYIELQVVRNTQPGAFIYAGAVEVKKGTDLSSHVEQAKREAFTMWCFNAQQPQPSYQTTWVILTNTRQLMRVTYTGHNVPEDQALSGAGTVKAAQVYRKKMPTKEVYGKFEITDIYNLLTIGKGCSMLASRESEQALEVLVSGFLQPDKLPTLETLKQRYQKFTKDIKSLADGYMRDVKRLRDGSQDAVDSQAQGAEDSDRADKKHKPAVSSCCWVRS